MFSKSINNLIINNRGTALFLALMILTGVLIVSLGAASLISSGLKQSRTQTHSTKAYFAAEAGAERVLWEIRKNKLDLNLCTADTDYITFDPTTCGVEDPDPLTNEATYSVFYKTKGSASTATTTESMGDYSDVKRKVEISY
jgi:hypothetical protein